jgi:integrase/recombinase XerC
MSAVANTDALTYAAAVRIIRDAVKDQSYRATPLGTMVGRYIRWLRNEYGATPTTIRDYEAILARMCLTLADKDPIEVSIEDLRDFIDLWAARTARTRQKVTSVVRAFWAWMEEQGHIAISPAARIRRPRAERKVARVLPLTAKPQLLTQAKHPRDRLALFCLLGLGLRKSELGGIRVRDFDADRGVLRVYGKGQKERLLPLRGPILTELRLYLATDLPRLGRVPEGDDYLLYPSDKRAGGKGRELEIRWVWRPRPKDPMSSPSVHRWWYKQAQAAGLVGPGVTSGLNMHQARHLFAVELRRVAGVEATSNALGHSDLSTTLGIYGHFDMSDLEQAMERYAAWTEDSQIVSPEEEA